MGLFSDIPVRSNGDKIYRDFFNLLRTAGIAVENFLGSAFITETSVTISNTQSSAANVTGLVFDSSSVKSAIIYATIRRKTDDAEVVSTGVLIAQYSAKDLTWYLIDQLSGLLDDGVELDITSAGQVQYTSDTVPGANYSGAMSFKAITLGN